MFERLLDLLAQFGKHLAPFVVVVVYQNVGILRFGRYHRTLGPGFHWKWPFIEDGYPENVVPTTIRLQAQTVTTADDETIVVDGVVRYRVVDLRAFLTGIYDQRDLLVDTSMGAVLKAVRKLSLKALLDEPPEARIASDIRRQVKPFGVEIDAFTFTDLGRVKTLRLMTGAQPVNLDN